jgi:ligand-binding sensor domain-containing protein
VVVDGSGRLWVNGSRLYHYDGSSWQGVDSPGGVIVALLPRPDGSLWVATTEGLFAYGAEGYQRLTDAFTERSRSVRALADAGAGRVWLATMDGQVLGYAAGAFHRVREVGGAVQALCRDRGGRLWVGTYGDGLYSYDTRRFRRFTPAQGLPAARVLCLAETADGTLWVGTQRGLVGYDGRTFAAPAYGAEVSDHAIAALTVDPQDRLWVGTYVGGVYGVVDGP